MTAMAPTIFDPYMRAIIMLVTRPMTVAIMRAPKAHAEPVKISEKSLPRNNLKRGIWITTKAHILTKQGKYEAARTYYEAGYEIFSLGLHPDSKALKQSKWYIEKIDEILEER